MRSLAMDVETPNIHARLHTVSNEISLNPCKFNQGCRLRRAALVQWPIESLPLGSKMLKMCFRSVSR